MQRRKELQKIQKGTGKGQKAMDRSQVKIYLSGYKRARERERQVAEELARIEEGATSTTAKINGIPGNTGPGDKVGNGSARAADKRTLLQEIRTESEALRTEIFLTINAVKSSDRSEVLNRHYIGGQGFAQIADAMFFSERWVAELHRRGLDDVAEILERVH